ncbi:MAG: electron transport complex subunit RsxB [Woeseiaceae bacterium]|jgi:electron transport complex protein RnfB|nr:electron transport complex subunit RsxB [Woeseiaceae bacterium]
MLTAVVLFAAIALIAGVVLAYTTDRLPAPDDDIVERIDELLPQTQCAQCGYPGCRPYARAIADGDAPINLCPPGGETTVRRLAELLGREPLPLESPPPVGQVAVIDESRCIGCLHCRNACPVDAIVGAQSLMHTIIESECTGCELCIEPCPVDCIELRRTA